MSAQQEDKVTKFVRRTVAPSAANTRIVLAQLATSGGVNLVRNFDLQSSGYSDDEITNLTAELLVAAQEDADSHQSVSKYCFRACKGMSMGERVIITLRSQLQDEDNLGSTELPNAAGLTAQLMRHNEALMRSVMQQQEIASRQSTDIIARLVSREQHYEDRHWENLIRTEELLSEKDSREIAKMEAIAKSKRLDDVVKILKPLAPALMSKLKGLPSDAKATLKEDTIKALLADLSQSDMEKIANILGPRSLALAELYIDAKQGEAEEYLEGRDKH